MAKRKFLSFKPIAGTILGLAFVTITGVNVYLVMEGQKNLSDSDVTLKNIEAIATGENTAPDGYSEKSTLETETPGGYWSGMVYYSCSITVTTTCGGVGSISCVAGITYKNCTPTGGYA